MATSLVLDADCQRRRQRAQRHHGRRGAPHGLVLRLDRRAGWLADLHRRRRRRAAQPQACQCPAEGPGGAASARAVPGRQPRAGPPASHDPLALPQAGCCGRSSDGRCGRGRRRRAGPAARTNAEIAAAAAHRRGQRRAVRSRLLDGDGARSSASASAALLAAPAGPRRSAALHALGDAARRPTRRSFATFVDCRSRLARIARCGRAAREPRRLAPLRGGVGQGQPRGAGRRGLQSRSQAPGFRVFGILADAARPERRPASASDDANLLTVRGPPPIRVRARLQKAVNGRQAALLHHHRDRLSERRAAYRPRLRGDRDRRDRALQAARRLRRVLPDRHRRARPEDAADRAPRKASPRANCWSATCRASRPWSTAELLQRRLHPHHRSAPSRVIAWRSGSGWRRTATSISDKYSGWYSVRDEAFYDENETRLGEDGVRLRTAGHAGRMGARRRATSSASPPIRTGCSTSTPACRTSCCRRNGATRSRASSKAACRTCRSRAPPSTGASRCRATPST